MKGCWVLPFKYIFVEKLKCFLILNTIEKDSMIIYDQAEYISKIVGILLSNMNIK